jgi:hypothetical protein
MLADSLFAAFAFSKRKLKPILLIYIFLWKNKNIASDVQNSL